jgi:predicted nucleotidyltransferase
MKISLVVSQLFIKASNLFEDCVSLRAYFVHYLVKALVCDVLRRNHTILQSMPTFIKTAHVSFHYIALARPKFTAGIFNQKLL